MSQAVRNAWPERLELGAQLPVVVDLAVVVRSRGAPRRRPSAVAGVGQVEDLRRRLPSAADVPPRWGGSSSAVRGARSPSAPRMRRTRSRPARGGRADCVIGSIRFAREWRPSGGGDAREPAHGALVGANPANSSQQRGDLVAAALEHRGVEGAFGLEQGANRPCTMPAVMTGRPGLRGRARPRVARATRASPPSERRRNTCHARPVV